jgi:serine/threonine-protein kinase
MILGTVQYMAPEQLQGKEADARSDLFAFGTVLYEMLTGKPAFHGDSQAALIGAILRDQPPPITTHHVTLPTTLQRAINACLAKDPEDRWQTAPDLARALRWTQDELALPTDAPTHDRQPVVRAPRPTRGVLLLAVAVALAAGLAAGAAIVWKRRAPVVVSGASLRTQLGVAPAAGLERRSGLETRIASSRPSRTALSLSPDGQALVFAGNIGDKMQLFRRALNRQAADPIPDTTDAESPFFSTDGRWVGFWSNGHLRKVSSDGGPAVDVADTPRIIGASWSGERIVYGSGCGGIFKVAANGGSPERLTTLDSDAGETCHRFPTLVNGSDLVFTVMHGAEMRRATIVSYRGATASRTVLVENGTDARIVSGRFLVFIREGTLMAVRFDAKALRVAGDAVPVVSGVMQSANNNGTIPETGAGQFAISDAGHLAYLTGGVYPELHSSFAWFARNGDAASIPAETHAYLGPRLSPDGNRITGYITQGAGGLFTYDLSRQAFARLRFDGGVEWPLWTPDGKRVVFMGVTNGRYAIYSIPSDGSGTAERLTALGPQDEMPASWSPGGRELLFLKSMPGSLDIYKLSMQSRAVAPVLATKASEQYPTLSPDGRWLAYTSNDSGRGEVYVAPYASLDGRHQVSNNGGMSPVWTKGGRELLYYESVGSEGGRLMTVAVSSGDRFAAEIPRVLFEKSRDDFSGAMPLPGFAATPNGDRILGVVRDRARYPPPNVIEFVVNWLTELQSKLPD